MVEALKYSLHPLNMKDLFNSQATNTYIDKQYSDIVEHVARFSIFGSLRKLREQRMLMVQVESQYKFLYYFMQLWVQRNVIEQLPRIVELSSSANSSSN
mmetsp:Transcript_15557/g.26283  ORF Transcript_15557/g.26283 Transcript_15557/m.26283 type:complete len:99 (-) Transcript_15557:189-485(-)